jgi:FKBP-type peptidyl-prolyl cis-trans isomerase FkpA
MRGLLILVSATLMAQTTPPKPAPTAAKGTTPAPKPAASKAKAAPPKPAAAKPKPVAPALATDDQKTIYALGASIYDSLAPFYLSPAELEIVKRAISDTAAKKPAIDVSGWDSKIQALGHEREKAASQAYLAKTALQPGVTKTESGLLYREVTPGTGASPVATDVVKVNYRGTFVNGREFDSSYKRNQPAQFSLNGVIPCWTEGVQKMKVGGKSILVCPSAIAYGDAGRPSIPGGAALIFEIELLSVGAN